jgi:hypothetical protein
VGNQYKSLRQIIAEGGRYMALSAAASLALGVLWQAARGGGDDLDMFGLRLLTSSFVVLVVAVFVFGGNQAGVAALVGQGISRETIARLMRQEIEASEAQRFHPLHALLGAAAVAALGVLVMLLR